MDLMESDGRSANETRTKVCSLCKFPDRVFLSILQAKLHLARPHGPSEPETEELPSSLDGSPPAR